jgi:8-oxo-dGTP pyrophosphatase MutT (NUDIX family)
MRRATSRYRAEAASVPELAAGAILLSPANEVLLLHETREDRWCFPKGHVEGGESLAAAAIREIKEEADLRDFELVEEIGESTYRFFDPGKGANVFKTTVYFLGIARDRHVRPEVGTFDESRWVSITEARDLVPYDEDRRIIELTMRHLKKRG